MMGDFGGGMQLGMDIMSGLGEFLFYMAKLSYFLKIGIIILMIILVIKAIKVAIG